jgi:hypothetical protein
LPPSTYRKFFYDFTRAEYRKITIIQPTEDYTRIKINDYITSIIIFFTAVVIILIILIPFLVRDNLRYLKLFSFCFFNLNERKKEKGGKFI